MNDVYVSFCLSYDGSYPLKTLLSTCDQQTTHTATATTFDFCLIYIFFQELIQATGS